MSGLLTRLTTLARGIADTLAVGDRRSYPEDDDAATDDHDGDDVTVTVCGRRVPESLPDGDHPADAVIFSDGSTPEERRSTRSNPTPRHSNDR